MMKFVFALVVLLHLCYSTMSNMNLNMEMIERLTNLSKLYKDNISFPHTVHVPSTKMQNHASSCKGVFITELEHLLDNVTVHEDSKNILQELKANVQEFKANLTATKENGSCKMLKVTPPKSNNFCQYARFLQKLNNKLGK